MNKSRMISKKLSKIGKSSTMVILPKTWLDETNLNPGDTVFMTAQNTDLVISSEYAPKSERHEITADGKRPDELSREVIGSYIMGADEIVVRSSDAARYSAAVDEVTRKLSGTEVLRESEKEIVLKCILQPSELSIPGIVDRMKYLVDRILEATKDSIDGSKSDIAPIEENIDRLCFLGTRFLNKALFDPTFTSKLGILRSDIISYMLVIHALENIADYCEKITGVIDKVTDGESKNNIKDAIESSSELLGISLRAFEKKDKKSAHQAFGLYNDTMMKKAYLSYDLLEKSASKKKMPCDHLAIVSVHYCTRIWHLCKQIIETIYDLRDMEAEVSDEAAVL